MSTGGSIGYPAGASSDDISDVVVCASGVNYIRRSVAPGGGGAVVVTYLDGSGAIVATPAGVITVGACGVAGDDEFDLLCDLGTSPPTPFLQQEHVNEATGAVTYTTLTLAGAAYVLVGARGVCGPATKAVLSDLQAIAGAVAVNPATGHTGLQSVTLVVLVGTVNVTAPAGVVAVTAGVTLTWGITSEVDGTLTAPTFLGVAGCSAYVLTTYRP